jgi:hypothetical protein
VCVCVCVCECVCVRVREFAPEVCTKRPHRDQSTAVTADACPDTRAISRLSCTPRALSSLAGERIGEAEKEPWRFVGEFVTRRARLPSSAPAMSTASSGEYACGTCRCCSAAPRNPNLNPKP